MIESHVISGYELYIVYYFIDIYIYLWYRTIDSHLPSCTSESFCHLGLFLPLRKKSSKMHLEAVKKNIQTLEADSFLSMNICLEPQMFGETTISYVKVWNHPIETTIYKWLFGVPGLFFRNPRPPQNGCHRATGPASMVLPLEVVRLPGGRSCQVSPLGRRMWWNSKIAFIDRDLLKSRTARLC